ncbi:hypothetical protein ACFLRY_04065 [Bacteroidota bacterium]
MHIRKALLILFIVAGGSGFSQINRYWSQNFNDGSSMLAGAVVGGDAGAAAIFYNPANISEITESRFSLSLSLFSIDSHKLNNALGDGINLKGTRFTAQPRFISYLIKMEKRKNMSMEIAFMNVANSNIRLSHAEDKVIDILKDLPGEERYFGSYNQENIFRDDYFGAGLSYRLSENLVMGSSMFISVKSLKTHRDLEIEAGPLSDTVYIGANPIPAYSASYENLNEVRFQNFSMIWKLGFNYKINSVSLGINFTIPSIDLFTSGKFMRYKQQRSNISNPDGSGFMTNYIIIDQQENDDFKVRYKTPFSVAVGATFHSPNDPDKSFFITAEYFSKLSQYTIVDAKDYSYAIPSFASNLSPDLFDYSYAARDIVNVAIAYRWVISEDLLLLSGFKTDFNFLQGVELENNRLDNFHMNIYHLSAGVRFKLKQSVVLFGLQYSYSSTKGQNQIVNLKDPVEYNEYEKMPLVGNRSQTMDVGYNGVSFFIGATLNFTRERKKSKD